jgi:hypothetical protein
MKAWTSYPSSLLLGLQLLLHYLWKVNYAVRSSPMEARKKIVTKQQPTEWKQQGKKETKDKFT